MYKISYKYIRLIINEYFTGFFKSVAMTNKRLKLEELAKFSPRHLRSKSKNAIPTCINEGKTSKFFEVKPKNENLDQKNKIEKNTLNLT